MAAAIDTHIHGGSCGIEALHADGLYVDRDLELPVKRALIRAADHVVVVATSGKMNHLAIVHLMDFDAVDTLVTDSPLPPAIAKALARANVRVVTADQAGLNGHKPPP
ncbi:hypothetical protein [Arthrobacter sp. MMS18-M83]|uniref:hypothetical protein n=1 Tax=Arthrobacter sp. MMS18-M83 TaxID=2996261 RepID=UPI00227BC559|nr:hypothetical protein [Arthrobacter sp. MMS18-M83]WAH98243.1 hypothetical protein OW521_05035 [Arthrobacter sp. MMS18-M83]